MSNINEVNFPTKTGAAPKTEAPAKPSSDNAAGKSSASDKIDGAKKMFPAQESKQPEQAVEEQLTILENNIIALDMDEKSLDDLMLTSVKLLNLCAKTENSNEKSDCLALIGFCNMKSAYIYLLKKGGKENYNKCIKTAKDSFKGALHENLQGFRANFYASMYFKLEGFEDSGKFFAERCYKYNPAKFKAFSNLYLYQVKSDEQKSPGFILKYIAEIEKFMEKNTANPDIDAYKAILEQYLTLLGQTEDKEKRVEYIKKAHAQGVKMLSLVTSAKPGNPQDQYALSLFLAVFNIYKQEVEQ